MPDEPAPVLEPAAQALVDATARPPYLWRMPPGEPCGPATDERRTCVAGVRTRIVRPAGLTGRLPVILYLHGWDSGTAHTHDRLVRELAAGAGAAVVLTAGGPVYGARYPLAVEENYALARWITNAPEAGLLGLDGSRLALVGDSAGGNLAAALTLLAGERGDIRPVQQVLFCPVTDAAIDTPSYHRFAEGYYLRRDTMRRLWQRYTPDAGRRAEITASPLRATVRQLHGLPPALVITAEADVLRDEGEAYAAKLRTAGVPVVAVRYGGTVHGFVTLDALRGTYAADAAIGQAVDVLRTALAR